MSLVFSDTTTKAGIVQLIDANCKSNNVSYPIAEKTRDVNIAVDEVFGMIFRVGGTWQFDDANHTDYPTITTNIASGVRDYPFTSDENGNLILDIYRVQVADSTGLFYDLEPQDVSGGNASSNYTDGSNTTGLPNSYDKLANAIFLDPIPNYNRSNGLKVYINREGSYFTSSDTTKKAGFAGLFHEYLALRPSYYFAVRNSLPNVNKLKEAMEEMKVSIMDYYKAREKDVQKVLQVRRNSAH